MYEEDVLLNPNCSEIVVRLSGTASMKKPELLKELKTIGITEKTVSDFYDFTKDKDKLIADKDNPNTPDYAHHATIRLYHNEGNWEIWANQHCQSQTFPTLKKIADHFDEEPEANDGGSMEDYEDWIAKGCPEIEDYNKAERMKRDANEIEAELNKSNISNKKREELEKRKDELKKECLSEMLNIKKKKVV